MAIANSRNNLYFPPEVDRLLDQMIAECMVELGRMPGRGGGWRSRLVAAAIAGFDVKAYIAAERAEREAEQRPAA